jgi:hypothetical protein
MTLRLKIIAKQFPDINYNLRLNDAVVLIKLKASLEIKKLTKLKNAVFPKSTSKAPSH